MKLYKIAQICDINPKTTIAIGAEEQVSFIPMNAVSTDGKIDTSKTISLNTIKNYTIFKNGDILFAKITPCMENGKGAIVEKLKNGYGAGSTEFIVLRPKQELVKQKWIQFFLSQKAFRLYCQQHMTGSAGQKRVPPKFLANCDIPIPLLPEQERIIIRIEELFSQLDASVNKLKTAKERLKVYRQAVLKEAFQGLEDSVSMREVATMIDPQPSHRTPPEVIGGVPYIGIGDIDYQNKKILFDLARKVSPELLEEHKSRYILHPGDFIMGKIGTIGKPYQIQLPQDYTLSANVILIQPHIEKILPEFLFRQFSSPLVTQQLSAGSVATSQAAFGIKKARELKIKICPLAKQQSILYDIDEKISNCDSIEKTVNTALQQAEALRQSILKKAFEGGLW